MSIRKALFPLAIKPEVLRRYPPSPHPAQTNSPYGPSVGCGMDWGLAQPVPLIAREMAEQFRGRRRSSWGSQVGRGNQTPERSGSRWVEWGRWLFRHRGWVFSPLGGILFFQAVGRYLQGCGEVATTGFPIWLTAFSLIGLGVFIRLHVAGRALPGTSSRGITFEAGQLITTGLYAYVRNPLYLANLMIWGGLALLVAPVWWVGLFIGLAGLFYHLIVLAEEDFLLGRFGPRYIEYCCQTPRWIPSLPPLRCIAQKDGVPLSLAEANISYCSGTLAAETASESKEASGAPMDLRDWQCRSKRKGIGKHWSHRFTWRRALFREADGLMLILLAVWAFAGLREGRLPWEFSAGTWGPFGLGVVGMAAVGWGWIKWLKKRSWPSSTSPSPAPKASEPGVGFGLGGSVVGLVRQYDTLIQ